MSDKDTGGSAFPVQYSEGSVAKGMTLRDYFAAKAMQYWLSLPIDDAQLAKVGTEAYRFADAMLEARKSGG